jgi:hypothetical protein
MVAGWVRKLLLLPITRSWEILEKSRNRLTRIYGCDIILPMSQMPTDKMRIYQRERREAIRGGKVVATVSGVLALVRGLEDRVGRLEKWVKEVDEMGEKS